MVSCLLCSSPRSIGVLCTSHGVAIASPGITSEQIFSRVPNPAASLIDAWGVWQYLLNPKKKKVIERVERAAERIERQVEAEEAI